MSSPTNNAAITAALATSSNIPSRVTAAFLRETRDEPAIIAILFVGAIVLVFASLRCWARVFIVKDFGVDDWLALISLVSVTSDLCESFSRAHQTIPSSCHTTRSSPYASSSSTSGPEGISYTFNTSLAMRQSTRPRSSTSPPTSSIRRHC